MREHTQQVLTNTNHNTENLHPHCECSCGIISKCHLSNLCVHAHARTHCYCTHFVMSLFKTWLCHVHTYLQKDREEPFCSFLQH